MKKFILALIFLMPVLSNAQTFWKYYGYIYHSGTYAFQTSDGGNLLVTSSSQPGNSSTFYINVIKTDITGNLLWSKLINEGDSSRCLNGFALEVSTGGYLISGKWNDSTGAGIDICLIKLDIAGNLLWIKTYPLGGGSQPFFSNLFVKETFDRGFVVSGGDRILKTDSTGNILWIKEYKNFSTNFVSFRGQFIETSDSGFIFLTGYGGSGPTTLSDVILIKTDLNGNIQWNKTYTDTSNFILTNIYETIDGYIFTKGANIIKTDFAGDTLWTKTYDLKGTLAPHISFIIDNGNIIAATLLNQSITNDLVLFKTDSTGKVIWTRNYLDNNVMKDFHWIYKCGDGYMINGRYLNQGFPSLMKTDSLGFTGCPVDTTPINYLPNNIVVATDSVTDSLITATFQIPIPVIVDTGITNNICFTTDITYYDSNQWNSIFPNPSSGKINFRLMDNIKSLIIYDLIGNEIYSQTHVKSSDEIDLTKLSKGIYLCKIFYEQQKTESFKLILQ